MKHSLCPNTDKENGYLLGDAGVYVTLHLKVGS